MYYKERPRRHIRICTECHQYKSEHSLCRLPWIRYRTCRYIAIRIDVVENRRYTGIDRDNLLLPFSSIGLYDTSFPRWESLSQDAHLNLYLPFFVDIRWSLCMNVDPSESHKMQSTGSTTRHEASPAYSRRLLPFPLSHSLVYAPTCRLASLQALKWAFFHWKNVIFSSRPGNAACHARQSRHSHPENTTT